MSRFSSLTRSGKTLAILAPIALVVLGAFLWFLFWPRPDQPSRSDSAGIVAAAAQDQKVEEPAETATAIPTGYLTEDSEEVSPETTKPEPTDPPVTSDPPETPVPVVTVTVTASQTPSAVPATSKPSTSTTRPTTQEPTPTETPSTTKPTHAPGEMYVKDGRNCIDSVSNFGVEFTLCAKADKPTLEMLIGFEMNLVSPFVCGSTLPPALVQQYDVRVECR